VRVWTRIASCILGNNPGRSPRLGFALCSLFLRCSAGTRVSPFNDLLAPTEGMMVVLRKILIPNLSSAF